jgi:hypothetical protein
LAIEVVKLLVKLLMKLYQTGPKSTRRAKPAENKNTYTHHQKDTQFFFVAL